LFVERADLSGAIFVSILKKKGYSNIKAADVKIFDDWFQLHDGVKNCFLDLRKLKTVRFS
jgi:hypothetical protein